MTTLRCWRHQEAATKTFIVKVDTGQSITQWHWRTPTNRNGNEPLRPDPREAEHVVVNCLPMVRNEPQSRNLPQSDSEKEAERETQKEPQPMSKW